jgi:hypothetical protein
MSPHAMAITHYELTSICKDTRLIMNGYGLRNLLVRPPPSPHLVALATARALVNAELLDRDVAQVADHAVVPAAR